MYSNVRWMGNMNEERMKQDTETNIHLSKLINPDQFVHSVVDIPLVKQRCNEENDR